MRTSDNGSLRPIQIGPHGFHRRSDNSQDDFALPGGRLMNEAAASCHRHPQ